MTATIIDGKAIAADLRAAVAAEVKRINATNGLQPGLAVVLVGDNPASKSYVGSKTRAVIEAGMRPFDFHLPESTGEDALLALVREGLTFREFPLEANQLLCRWAKAVAECLARGECAGGVLFCDDPGLVSCVANKVSGLRSAPVTTVAQAIQATTTLAVNLLVVEMPGRTFFEIRQILRTAATTGKPDSPVTIAQQLRELEANAHR